METGLTESVGKLTVLSKVESHYQSLERKRSFEKNEGVIMLVEHGRDDKGRKLWRIVK